MVPAWASCAGRSVSAEPPRQLDVEGVEVDVADPPSKELGGPGVGQTLGETVSPGLVFLLQGPELGRSSATAEVQRAGRGFGRAAGRSGRCLTGTAARRRSRNRRWRSAFVRAMPAIVTVTVTAIP